MAPVPDWGRQTVGSIAGKQVECKAYPGTSKATGAGLITVGSSFEGVPFMFAHVVRVPLDPDAVNLLDTCGAVRPKQKGKHLRNEVVKLSAFGWVRELAAIGAGRQTLLSATSSDFAPGGALVFVATRAFFLQIGWASPAVETAVSDEIRI